MHKNILKYLKNVVRQKYRNINYKSVIMYYNNYYLFDKIFELKFESNTNYQLDPNDYEFDSDTMCIKSKSNKLGYIRIIKFI